MEKRFNKHLWVWVFNGCLGVLGVDRFMRGQILFGILKLITFGGFSIWVWVDFIIALIKAYGAAYKDENEVVFIDGAYSK